ncbi:MAG: 5'-nucleotidase, partial [Proteobacteria bacterium]|nr:5'-nucleotidase [Pseudomonadota bacterium]
MLLLNAGNLLFKREYLSPDRVPPARLTADLILDGYGVMGCDALAIGAYDLSLGTAYLL